MSITLLSSEWMSYCNEVISLLSYSFVFWWLAIPWIQVKLDGWVRQCNQIAPHHDKNKILPHGISKLIHLNPEQYNSLDFKVCQHSDIINLLMSSSDHHYSIIIRWSWEYICTKWSLSFPVSASTISESCVVFVCSNRTTGSVIQHFLGCISLTSSSLSFLCQLNWSCKYNGGV